MRLFAYFSVSFIVFLCIFLAGDVSYASKPLTPKFR